MANRLYAQMFGSMHHARVGVAVRESAGRVAETFDLDPERVREAYEQDVLARITDGAWA